MWPREWEEGTSDELGPERQLGCRAQRALEPAEGTWEFFSQILLFEQRFTKSLRSGEGDPGTLANV